MPSPAAVLVENLRQQKTGDKLFYRRMPPVLELRVPAKITKGQGSRFYFPFPMPPQELTIEYPFASEVEPTLGAGVVSEANGVVIPVIRMSGTMGQRPKLYRGSYFGSIEPAERRLSRHDVVRRTMAPYELSGHRFLLHLENSVLGLYSDLKQDPEVSEETHLILHIPKDDKHFVVEPELFVVPKSVQNRNMGDWSITFKVLALAKGLPKPSEDKSLLARLANAAATFRSGIRMARAALQDLSRIRAEIEGIARVFSSILDDISSVIEEAATFIEGVKDVVPATRTRLEAALDRLEAAQDAVGDQLSDDTAQLLMEVSDSVHELLLNPEIFEPRPEDKVEQAFRQGLGLLAERDRAALTAASEEEPPGSEAELRSAGTLPGDLVRDDRARELPEELRQYRSAFEHELQALDTLQGLAARYLGDARLWRHIAILNGLSEPYLSPLGLPGTLAPGAKIQIPSQELPARRTENPAVLGSRPEDPIEVRELGRDWLVSRDRFGREDWVVDEDAGSTDLRVAEGRTCLAQDLLARLERRAGSDPLYTSLGLEPLTNTTEDVLGIAAFRVQEALEADPRVASTIDVDVTRSVDKIEIQASVTVRGLRDPLTVLGSTPET